MATAALHGLRAAARALALLVFAGMTVAARQAAAGSAVVADSFTSRFAVLDRVARSDLPPQDPVAAARPDVGAGTSAAAQAAGPVSDPRARYRFWIEREARDLALAPDIAEAVLAVESGYRPDAIGSAGEIGLMQILPSTARMLGFAGTLADLAVPETNIHYGVTYLAQAWRLAGGDLCTAVMKYRAGHGESRFSQLSVNYCLAVRAKLMARGFPLTGRVPVATFGEGGPIGCARRCLGGGLHRGTGVDIAALNSSLAALVAQVRQGR